jgi:filamentous hemagglutinin
VDHPAVLSTLQNVTAGLVGAAAGGAQGATAAFSADANNRQLHPDEAAWIRANAKKFAQQLKNGQTPTTTEITAAEKRLADQAWRDVQLGTPGTTDTVANAFLLSNTQGMLLPGDANIPGQTVGYMFKATADQKANPNMYANLYLTNQDVRDFYTNNGLKQPSQKELQDAVQRYASTQDKLGLATKAAAVAAAGLMVAPLAPAGIGWCLRDLTLCTTTLANAFVTELGPMGTNAILGWTGIKAVSTAAKANADWIAINPLKNVDTWVAGQSVFQADIKAGNKFIMYVDNKQRIAIDDGNLLEGLGGFFTFDAKVSSVAEMRSKYAITEGFKSSSNGPFYAVELETIKTMPTNVGLAGPQLDALTGKTLPGRSNQGSFIDYFNRASYVKVNSFTQVKP